MPQAHCSLFQHPYSFTLSVDTSDPNDPNRQYDDVINVALAGPNSKQLFIFSGVVNVDFRGTDWGQTQYGLLWILLDLDLSSMIGLLKDATVYVGLAGELAGHPIIGGIFGDSPSTGNKTFAINCAEVDTTWTTSQGGNKLLPAILREIAVAGGGDVATLGVLSQVAYQAFVQVDVGINLLVSYDTPIAGPDYQSATTVLGGQPFLSKVTIPYIAPAAGMKVELQCLDTSVIPNLPPSVTIPPQQKSIGIATQTISPASTKVVPIIASLNGLTSTATVTVLST